MKESWAVSLKIKKEMRIKWSPGKVHVWQDFLLLLRTPGFEKSVISAGRIAVNTTYFGLRKKTYFIVVRQRISSLSLLQNSVEQTASSYYTRTSTVAGSEF
jgi:hypothetical protein